MFSVLAGYYKNNEKFRLFTKIIVVWLLSRLVMLIMVQVMNLEIGRASCRERV